jgi:FkbM family methyltransferase
MRLFLWNLYARVFVRKLFYYIHRRLTLLGLMGMGRLLNSRPEINGERWLLKKLGEHKRNPVVIDGGANVGRWSAELRQWCPRAYIVAIEPNPIAYERLLCHPSLEAMPGSVHGVALVSEPGQYFLSDTAHGASVDSSIVVDWPNHTRHHEVEGITLAFLFVLSRLEGEHVDLLKLELEGCEYPVLERAVSDGC